MRGRKLRPDETELWNKVASNVTRTMAERFELPGIEKPKPAPEPSQPKKLVRMPSMSGGKSPLRDNLAPSLSQQLQSTPVQMDRKAFNRLRQGKLKPDARIDLHGMTQERAHAALTGFVMSSHGQGKRLLLVITGKGKHRDEGGPIPVRFGVLRHQVPQWLKLPPMSGLVLQVAEAHRSHGGDGACYVYLRRSR